MSDSPHSAEALSPGAEDFNRSLGEYEQAANGAAKRCDALFDSDRATKELQTQLFDLLATGDAYWVELEKNNKDERTAEALRDCIAKMRANLVEQEKGVNDLEKAVNKAARSLDQYAHTIAGLREHVVDVRQSLNERVASMEDHVPILKLKKKRSASPSGRSLAQEPKATKEDTVRRSRKKTVETMDPIERAAMLGAERALAKRGRAP